MSFRGRPGYFYIKRLTAVPRRLVRWFSLEKRGSAVVKYYEEICPDQSAAAGMAATHFRGKRQSVDDLLEMNIAEQVQTAETLSVDATAVLSGEDAEKEAKLLDAKRKQSLQHILSLVRKAVQDYDLIGEGDRICVGISGGKDSVALLSALAALRRFYPKKFELRAMTVAMGFPEMDFSEIAAYCKSLDVPYDVIETHIKEIVFDLRDEKNPCALCANLRRGALNDSAAKAGCNVVALGHHRNDVVETAFLSLSYEGRFYCFMPKTYLERCGVTVIRPMIYVDESDIRAFRRLENYPVVANPCPMDLASKRSDVKKILDELNAGNRFFRENVFGAVKRGIWKEQEVPQPDRRRKKEEKAGK